MVVVTVVYVLQPFISNHEESEVKDEVIIALTLGGGCACLYLSTWEAEIGGSL